MIKSGILDILKLRPSLSKRLEMIKMKFDILKTKSEVYDRYGPYPSDLTQQLDEMLIIIDQELKRK